MHQCTCNGKNKKINSSYKIEHYKNVVDDRSIKVGGGKYIATLEKCKIIMSIRNALPCVPLSPCTDDEWENLSHAIITSNTFWDLASLDCEGKLDNE